MLLGNFQDMPVESSGRIMSNFSEYCILNYLIRVKIILINIFSNNLADNIIKFNTHGGVVKKSTGLHYMLNGLNVDLDIDSIESKLEDLYSNSDVKGELNYMFMKFIIL